MGKIPFSSVYGSKKYWIGFYLFFVAALLLAAWFEDELSLWTVFSAVAKPIALVAMFMVIDSKRRLDFSK